MFALALAACLAGISLPTCGGDLNDESEIVGAEEIESVTLPLSSQECSAAGHNGKITICHKTSSTKNPYTTLKVSQAGCRGHVKHSGDFVAIGGKCLPPNQCLLVGSMCDPNNNRCCGSPGSCGCPEDPMLPCICE